MLKSGLIVKKIKKSLFSFNHTIHQKKLIHKKFRYTENVFKLIEREVNCLSISFLHVLHICTCKTFKLANTSTIKDTLGLQWMVNGLIRVALFKQRKETRLYPSRPQSVRPLYHIYKCLQGLKISTVLVYMIKW